MSKMIFKDFLRILSDVDDTIKCSGGPYGGGVDEAGYRKEVYPGAIQFMLELARGPRLVKPPSVKLLSARPKKLGFLRMKPTSRVAREFQRVALENDVAWGIDFEGSENASCVKGLFSRGTFSSDKSKILQLYRTYIIIILYINFIS